MTISEFKRKLKENPNNVAFSETIELIEAHYDFTPTSFVNGDLTNKAGENSGSCKVFAFAKAQSLSKEEALAFLKERGINNGIIFHSESFDNDQYFFHPYHKLPRPNLHSSNHNFEN